MGVLNGWRWDAKGRELEVEVIEDGHYGARSTHVINGDAVENALGVDDLRAQVARLTAERDGWHNRSEYWEISSRKAERERDQSRKEVAAMEAAARTAWEMNKGERDSEEEGIHMARIGTCIACKDILDALKKARGE